MLPIFNTASEVGYGAVIATMAGFALIRNAVLNVSPNNPLISETVAMSTLAGITGSSSGGLSIALQTLGADYLAMAERFHTLFVEAVPALSSARHHEARRFVTLIDALYEAKTRLVVQAEAPPESLYPEGTGAFEFERTVSRLQEMSSASWLDARQDD